MRAAQLLGKLVAVRPQRGFAVEAGGMPASGLPAGESAAAVAESLAVFEPVALTVVVVAAVAEVELLQRSFEPFVHLAEGIDYIAAPFVLPAVGNPLGMRIASLPSGLGGLFPCLMGLGFGSALAGYMPPGICSSLPFYFWVFVFQLDLIFFFFIFV